MTALPATKRRSFGAAVFTTDRLGRAAALRLGLPVADKRDSQDICFVPSGHYAEVVERLRPGAAEPGDIVDLAGRVLGRHAGVIHYTVGQRRGIGVGGSVEPLYVVRLEPDTQRVVVGRRAALDRRTVQLAGINWLDDVPLQPDGRRVSIKLRATHRPIMARLRPTGAATAEVTLETPEAGVAPGQAGVFYDGDRLLGGGWIQASPPP